MTTLSGLSSEALSFVLSAPGLKADVLNLWKCGNKALNNRLRLCKDLSIRLESYNRTPRWRFPKVLFSLPLTKLVIYSPGFEFESPRGMSEALQQLPKTLKSLRMDVPSPYACLVDFASFPASVTRPFSALRKDKTNSHIWNIGSVLPHLETLIVCTTDTSNEYWLTNADLELLPASLTHLNLQLRKKNSKVSDLTTESLPRGLRRLELYEAAMNQLSQIENLPPQLEYLGESCLRQRFIQDSAAEILARLPKTLTEMECFGFEMEHYRPGSVPHLQAALFEDSPKLASSLTSFLTVLPHLTRLELFPIETPSPSFTPAHLYCLPSTITQLQIPSHNNFDAKAWPSSLTDLRLNYAGSLNKTACLALPPVKLLWIHSQPPLPFQMPLLIHIPRSVTDLQVEFAIHNFETQREANADNPTNDDILEHDSLQKTHYPPHLTSLSISSYPNMTPSILSHLPDSLLTLRTSVQGDITADVAMKLPPNLTLLESSFAIVTAAGIAHLPSSLTSLTFSALKFEEGNSSPLEREALGCAVHLPSSLKVIEFAELSPNELPEGSYLVLPDSLETFSAGYPYLGLDMDLKIIRSLPPRLTELAFHLPAKVYPDPREVVSPTFEELLVHSWLPLLPSSLTSLSLSYPDSVSEISASVLDLINPNLVELTLSTGYQEKRCDLTRDFMHRRLLLTKPDPRLLNEIYGTQLESGYYELPRDATV